jgi:chromosome segregation ATPase
MYVGARYVPKFADPIEWDTERGYESLTIVTYKGESYTSKCPVPPGIDIKNERYWALTGAYNAQVEEYKNQVKDLSQQVTGFASDNKEFRDKITQYDKDNAEMKNTVASTVARVDALAERVDNADAAISDLQAGQAQTVKDIAALEAKDADLQRQITSNDTDISAIQAKDREQDARLSAIETVNDAQAATITQNTQDIARNTENIQDNAASIAVNSKELAKHAEQLKDHAAQLSVLHKEVTDNHTSIERLTSVTDGLRADLTEDEAKIAQNADAIAHIQQKDVEQDGRLDALEGRATTAEGRLDALDTKTDATNTALTAETNRAKAAEVANGKLIAANAQELARHSDELSDHERRISALETTTDGHTQSIADLKAKDAALDTAIAAVDDKVEHLELIDPKEYAKTIARIDAKDTAQDGEITALKAASADHVTKTEFAADQKRQDDIVGDWKTAHPNQSITQCVASMEGELTEHAGDIASLQTDKANKTDIPSLDGYATTVYVDKQDAARIPLKTGDYNNAASSIALGVPSHTADAPNVWSIFGLFPYPVFSYKDRPGVNVDTTKGKLHLYKADGTEVPVPNWVTTGNINNAFGVIARLGSDFTPDSPFYVVVYRNSADNYTTAGDVPAADGPTA